MKILLRFGSDKPQKYYRFLTAYRWQILWHLPTNELVRQISDNWGVSLENIEILGGIWSNYYVFPGGCLVSALSVRCLLVFTNNSN